MRRGFLAGLLAFVAALPVRACDLALALAVDVSGSVDHREYEVQIRGLAAALRDPVVADALLEREAALSLIQWTGTSRQAVSIPWVRIRGPEELESFATRVAATPRRWRNFSTAIGEALRLARSTFAEVPDCRHRVIDVSGDGSSNEGVPPESLRNGLLADRITVNGLVITGSEEGLVEYFHAHVIAGPGAFVIAANGYADYPDRIRQKLRRETARAISALPVCDHTVGECDHMGEKAVALRP